MTSVVDPRHSVTRQGLRALFALMMLVLLASCDRQPSMHSLSGKTMGTSWHIKLVGLPAGMTPPQLQQELQVILDTVNGQMSTYQPDSDISRFNQADAESWQTLPVDFYRVLDYALRLAGDTGGAYDPTVGPLVNLWGFGPDKSGVQAPTEAEIAEARGRVGWQKVKLDAATQRAFQSGGVYVDLSSVAKGYAVDKLADYLQGQGIENFLVEIGGELRASGEKPGGNAWKVAVEKPVPGEREIERILALSDIAVATSGDYRNFFEWDGQTYAHIIDPRTGMPVDHLTASVTVLADSCTEADALATALTVLGPEQGMTFADARQLAVLFMVRTDDGFIEQPSAAFTRFISAQQE